MPTVAGIVPVATCWQLHVSSIATVARTKSDPRDSIVVAVYAARVFGIRFAP